MKPPAGHLFIHDPDLGVDHKGRRYCRCGVVELAGDPRHTLPVTAGPDARELAAHDDESEAVG